MNEKRGPMVFLFLLFSFVTTASAGRPLLCAPDQTEEEAKVIVLNSLNEIQDCAVSFKIATECKFDKSSDAVLMARALHTCEIEYLSKLKEDDRKNFEQEYVKCGAVPGQIDSPDIDKVNCKWSVMDRLISKSF